MIVFMCYFHSRNNSNLEDLNVGSCRAINGDNVSIALAQHCKYALNMTSVNHNNKFRDIKQHDLTLLLSACRNLKVLDFWRCSSLGVDGLRQLVNSCSQLQQLDVGWW